jgi:uncharacterized membrane protein (UPF0136 family)
MHRHLALIRAAERARDAAAQPHASFLAAAATGSKRAIDSAIEQLMFFCEKASLAAPKITTSSAPAAAAPSKPFMFGVSTEYSVPGRRVMPAITSAPSAICGTHFGETNDAASMLTKPASVSRLISATLTSVGTIAFSFCSPSRGPTSTILTYWGIVMGSLHEADVMRCPLPHSGEGAKTV